MIPREEVSVYRQSQDQLKVVLQFSKQLKQTREIILAGLPTLSPLQSSSS